MAQPTTVNSDEHC